MASTTHTSANIMAHMHATVTSSCRHVQGYVGLVAPVGRKICALGTRPNACMHANCMQLRYRWHGSMQSWCEGANARPHHAARSGSSLDAWQAVGDMGRHARRRHRVPASGRPLNGACLDCPREPCSPAVPARAHKALATRSSSPGSVRSLRKPPCSAACNLPVWTTLVLPP